MTKLTRKLRDEIVLLLESYSSLSSGSVRDLTRECAWKARQLDIEEEPLTIVEVMEAAADAEWEYQVAVARSWTHEFVRADRRFLVRSADISGIVTATRYAPTDLLDGRLAALDEENKP